MYRFPFRFLVACVLPLLFSACANVIPPSGGAKDMTPPKLKSISVKDSLLNTRITRLELHFDEYIVVSDVAKELQISPTLPQNASLTGSGKTAILKIADSLLQDSTTYTISFGKAIKDLHEGNPFSSKPFIFSTGAWFDSLTLEGNITDAETGKTDSSGNIKVLLYDAKSTFDALAKLKPMYVTTVNNRGKFSFKGLPNKRFRIFALKEGNDNLQFDKDDEYIAFADTTYFPATDTLPILLSVFKELPDTLRGSTDTNSSSKKRFGGEQKTAKVTPALDAKTFIYKVDIDSSNREKRTQEITEPISIFLSRKAAELNSQRIALSSDSAGIEIEEKINTTLDSTKQKIIIATKWKPNTVYTLRLLKSFAKDSSGAELMPSKYFFRSKSEADYGKMDINIPERFVAKKYLLQVKNGTETVYLKPISSPNTSLNLLAPGDYTIRIIEDENGDGEWTTGSLKEKRHAEKVFPFPSTVPMKAGWEHMIDYEPKKTTTK